jgi:hypothetical protein
VWNGFPAGTRLELTQNFHNRPDYEKELWLLPTKNDDLEIPE